MPATHAVHTRDVFAAATLPYAPALQAPHTLVPADDALYAPAAQPVQYAELAAAATLLYAPRVQPVQTSDVVAVATLL